MKMINLPIKEQFQFSAINITVEFNHKVNILNSGSATGKSFLLRALQFRLEENGIRVRHVDYAHREFNTNNCDVLLLNNADVYLTSEKLAELIASDVIVIAILHNIPHYEPTSKVGRYSVVFKDKAIKTKGRNYGK